uniref:Uncharacterized protein n=1 Tax=Arundo donax TaxID=35708 RepID=A0A0A9BGZ4_ARUDO
MYMPWGPWGALAPITEIPCYRMLTCSKSRALHHIRTNSCFLMLKRLNQTSNPFGRTSSGISGENNTPSEREHSLYGNKNWTQPK